MALAKEEEATMPKELAELTRAECMALLSEGDFGRVVITSGTSQIPMIRPVNYRFDAATQSVVFRTIEGSKFHTLVHSGRAGFEIDGHDRDTGSGWSVIAFGTAELITQSAEIDRLSRLHFSTWPDGTRLHWIRIRARTVSGRRLGPAGAVA